ncbi:hypothetical protein [Legionella hackeliae]|uniref:Uncharacterized protein n=1 Tax=Legionella hackeliae TaxID=449 RepID=A0A0A8UU34_LEGHA|nr:hypothetical protein [Legionella hackeliae]KTD12799.1 hypothetical protein Lhac_1670 [Legionella hackeliae]CEK12223.1 protein of unknown function [Legionella hackeliae]STX49009.1 Uncharacterised protein [Legionella hackeliae]
MVSKNRHYQGTVKALIRIIKNDLYTLGKKIVKDFKQTTEINETLVEEWLRLRNAINTYKACEAYFRGSAFYRTDTYHFVNRALPVDEHTETITTISDLEGIDYYGIQPDDTSISERLHVGTCYVIKDNCHNVSKTLTELLFSRTALECSAALQIANYLTLLDFLKLIHGNQTGEQKFNILFGPKSEDKHNLNRLRIGTMNSVWTGSWYDFCPLYFFMKSSGQTISLEDLQTSPERFAGTRFYIKGHSDYLEKHPYEAAQGWNVTFLGLNETGAPLFLAACEYKQPFVLTYKEMLNLLTTGFNKFPSDNNNPFVAQFCKVEQMKGFKETSQCVFDTSTIKLLISNFPECLKQLHELSLFAYVYNIRRQGYDTNSTEFAPSDIHLPIILAAKDDHDKDVLNFSKASFRDDLIKKTRDDLGIGLKNM